MSGELLGLEIKSGKKFYDPGIQGWLDDPDSGRPRLVDVTSNASFIINSLLSLDYCLGEFNLSTQNRLYSIIEMDFTLK